MLVGGQSPLHAGRSVVAMLASAPQALEAVVASMRDSQQAQQIQGDLALLASDHVTSFRVTTPYTIGSLPFWMWPSWYLRDEPYVLVVLMLVGCALLGSALYWAMHRRADRRLEAADPTRARRLDGPGGGNAPRH